MPDTPPESIPSPDPEPISGPLPPLPWWLPGLTLGLIAALVAGLVSAAGTADAGPSGAHRAIARVLLRSHGGEPAVTDAERQRIAFLFRDRDLLARVLAAPEVAGTAIATASTDPIAALDQRLKVEVTEGDTLTVSLFGDTPEELGPVLDQLVARLVEASIAYDRKSHDEQIGRLEKNAAWLRTEIESQERALELVARANGGNDVALLRERLTRAETDFARGAPELSLLEKRVESFKKRQPPGGAADPVDAARLVDADPRVAPLVAQRAEAAVAVEKERAAATGAAALKGLQAKLEHAEAALAAARVPVKKEIDALLREAEARRGGGQLEELELRLAVARAARESLRQERDELRKTFTSAHSTGASAESVRRALTPVQDHLDKVRTQLVQLRTSDSSAESRVRVMGPVVVEPTRRPGRWSAAFGAAVRVFAVAFGLATAFQLTGLVFRALGHRG